MVRRHGETYELRETQATYSDYSDVKSSSLRPPFVKVVVT